MKKFKFKIRRRLIELIRRVNKAFYCAVRGLLSIFPLSLAGIPFQSLLISKRERESMLVRVSE